jgi:SagB-type dehydrogenase family enzyme
MKPKFSHFFYSLLCFSLIWPSLLYGQEVQPIQLPAPQMEGGRPLMEVLKDRASSRVFSNEELPMQTLSNILWAGFGINRPESGRRTAPSANNRQDIDIYVATAKGLFLYDAKANALIPILSEDIRALTGTQEYVKDAPVNLVYVSDFTKLGDGEESVKYATASAHTGFISQNVYLYCASEGLATVVRGSVDKPVLEAAMKLRPEQKVIFAQTVGYPGPAE